jgi:fumarate reductase flavoprotein subunit
MYEPRHFDLVAVGGGLTGICAAVRAAELGLRTAVLEAGANEGYLCSSRWAGGIFHVSYHDVKLSPDDLLAAINRQTGGEADQELAAMKNSARSNGRCWCSPGLRTNRRSLSHAAARLPLHVRL